MHARQLLSQDHLPLAMRLGLAARLFGYPGSLAHGHIAGYAIAIHAVHVGGALSLGFLQKVSMEDEEGVWIRSRILCV